MPSSSSSEPGEAPSPTLAELVRDLEALEALFATWDEPPRGAVQAYRTAIEGLHREAIRRLIAELKADSGALALLKKALGDEVVYAVLRHLGLVKASVQEKVEAALASVRPMLASHGGGVELVRVLPPDGVEVRFLGACDGCSASQLTFVAGVRKAIQEACPEIRRVVEVRGLALAAAAPREAPATGNAGVQYVSPFALAVRDGAGWIAAAALAEIPLGGILRREVGGRDLLLSRSGAAITCFTNACAHLALPLDEGEVRDGVLTCPHHGFSYLLESGECLTAPAVQLEQHAVRLVGDRVEIRLSR